jgi:hypothetical protein
MRAGVIVVLASLLSGCAGNNLSQTAVAEPIGQAEVDSKQAAIGTKRWFSGLGLVAICADAELSNGCTKPKAGAATVIEITPVRSQTVGIETVHAVYRVRKDNGGTGYISTIDFDNLTDSQEEHKEKTAKAAECDRRGGVRVGMTAEQVQASCWGKPRRVNRTITATRNSEQWVYSGNQYLYLDNGVVTAIQTH